MVFRAWFRLSVLIAFALTPVLAVILEVNVHYPGEWVKVTDRVYYFERVATSNSGAILMDDYVIIVDAGQEPQSGQDAVEKLGQITDKPVKYLVLTHYHDDHLMSIPWFKEQGVVVIAHQETVRIINEMGDKLIDQRIKLFGQRRPELKEILKDAIIDQPDVVFQEKFIFGSGEDRVELLYFGPARTPGDLFVWLPQERVLFTGDAINGTSVQPIHYDYPKISQWVSTIGKALELGVETYLPGHRKPFESDTVREIIAYYTDLRKGVTAYIDKGVPLAEIQKDFELDQYRHWRGYEDRFEIHIMVMYRELTGLTKKFYDIK